MKRTAKKMYLRLFHGRDTLQESPNGWGYDGPVIGPLDYVHTVYGDNINAAFEDEALSDFYLRVEEGCICYEGKYYGDWSVFHATPTMAAKEGATGGVRGRYSMGRAVNG